ncbi:MAG TPA: DUF6790 family protein [Methanoregulaceae archaeon]|nr:DUF6790 family protein [Methanoregulaceae archaeon]
MRNMATGKEDPKIASFLFSASLVVTLAGIFIAIYYLFVDAGLAYRIAAGVLVGVVGIISFVRHSVFYRSDQARMGWQQDHPEFQLEVGYANLAIGIVALFAAGLNWGPLACGMMLLTYGIYLLCALFLHLYEALHAKDIRTRATKSVINTGIFVIVLLVFAGLALSAAHTVHF